MRPSKHIGKTRQERKIYYDYLKNINYEPTVDDSLDFSESDSSKEDLSLSKARKPRQPRVEERILDHLKERWLYWFVGLISVALTWFFFNFNRDLGKIEGSISIILQDLSGIKGQNERFMDKIHSQELKIQENKHNIEILNNKLSSSRSSSRSR